METLFVMFIAVFKSLRLFFRKTPRKILIQLLSTLSLERLVWKLFMGEIIVFVLRMLNISHFVAILISILIIVITLFLDSFLIKFTLTPPTGYKRSIIITIPADSYRNRLYLINLSRILPYDTVLIKLFRTPRNPIVRIGKKVIANKSLYSTICVCYALYFFGKGDHTSPLPYVLAVIGAIGLLDSAVTFCRIKRDVYGESEYEMRELIEPLLERIRRGNDPNDPNDGRGYVAKEHPSTVPSGEFVQP